VARAEGAGAVKGTRLLLYFLSFVGLAATLALVLARVAQPGLGPLFLVAVVVAALAGSPGLFGRRAWPVALVLLPLGGFLLLRAQVHVPTGLHGVGAQLGFLLDSLRDGARVYAHEKFPLTVIPGDGLAPLLSLVVYAVAGLAAFLALSLRLALPAVCVVLVALGFGFTTDSTARLVWAPLAFLVLAGCMLVLSRSLRRERWRASDALAGAATATIAALLALSLLGATSVAASPPLWDWSSWGTSSTGDARIGYDWIQSSLHLLTDPSDAVVMRVQSPVASYWRANALSAFDGANWFTSPQTRVVPVGPVGATSYFVPSSSPDPPGRLVTESFAISSTYTDHLFVGGTPRTVLFDAGGALLWVTDGLALRLARAAGPDLRYTVTAVVPQVTGTELLDRGRAYPEDVVASSLQLPFPARAQLTGPSPEEQWREAVGSTTTGREWLGLYGLDEEIVGAQTDPYRIVVQVQQYLRTHHSYSLTPPPGDFESPYADFLFGSGAGYCQHFAGAMALLLRYNGIPARVAVGFSPGTKDGDGTFVVTRKDAHAWVEVYFPGAGWVPFDPTPGRTVPSPAASASAAASADSGAGSSEASGPGSPGWASARGRDPRGALAGAGRSSAGGGQPASPAGGRRLLAAAAVLAGLLVAWPAGRALLRGRAARRGSYARRLSASLALVLDDLRDHGVRVPPAQTLDETAVLLRSRFGVEAGPLIGRVQAVRFGGREATPEDLAGVVSLRRQLRRALRSRRGPLRRLLALYGAAGGAAR
jgi:transglutaminase-like putative cysteine protease